MLSSIVLNTIKRYNMLDGGCEITVALSGGADSVTLLYVLNGLKETLGVRLYAAHLNHCLRGKESDRDEQFVRELCEKMGVTLFLERADVKSFAQSTGDSIELAARKIRYEFLERVSKGLIATAHNANDNLETVLLNMSRGTAISGLCGIPPKRGRIIRPLIEVERCEIEQYCAENGLLFQTDSTNSDEAYTRNRIRHSIVPVLKTVNSGVLKNVSKMSEALRQDAEFLDTLANKFYETNVTQNGIDKRQLNQLHPSIKVRVIMRFYEERIGIPPEKVHIDSVLELLSITEGKRSVGRDFYAVLQQQKLNFSKLTLKHNVIDAVFVEQYPYTAHGVKVQQFDVKEFQNLAKINSLLLKNAADCDKIVDKLCIRGRNAGDSIKLCGRGVTKTFKKLFNENKTPIELRDEIIVASDGEGVVWLQGFGVDQRVQISDSTKSVVVFL